VALHPTLDAWIAGPSGPQPQRVPAVICLHRSHYPYELGSEEVLGLGGDAWYAIGPELVRENRLVAAVDLFGHGNRKNPLFDRAHRTPQRAQLCPAYHYTNAGTSLLARSVHDVRCLVQYLMQRGDVDRGNISLVGFGTGAFVGLMAALVEPGIAAVAAVGGVSTAKAAIQHTQAARSLDELEARRLFFHPFLYQPGIIPAGDVDHALSLLAPRPCRLVLFGSDRHWPSDGAEAVADAMEASYEAARAGPALEIVRLPGEPGEGPLPVQGTVEWLLRQGTEG
jgi:dienelactone hydrolase